MRERLNQLAERSGVSMAFTGIGSMMTVHLRRGPAPTPADVAQGDQALRELFFFDMLEQGIWMAPRGMINLSLPISDADTDRFVAAVEDFIEARGSLLK
jgi:glutamate-1-semialdehyde 2,1-aminomutase